MVCGNGEAWKRICLGGLLVAAGAYFGESVSGQEISEETLQRLTNATVLVCSGGVERAKYSAGFLYAVENSQGAIFTNSTAILEGAQRGANFRCKLNPGDRGVRTVETILTGVDESDRVAVLTLSDAHLPAPLGLDVTADVVESQRVFVLGLPAQTGPLTEPAHLPHAITPTAIAHVRRDKDGRLHLLQLAAGVNEWNEGGPVVTETGQLIGMAILNSASPPCGLVIPARRLQEMAAGRPDCVRFTHSSAQARDYTFRVDVDLIDPFSHFATVDLLSAPVPSADARLPVIPKYIPGVADVPLAVGMREDRMSIPHGGRSIEDVTWKPVIGEMLYHVQFRWTRKDGTVCYSNPAAIDLSRDAFTVDLSAPIGLDGENELTPETRILFEHPVSATALGGSGAFLVARYLSPPQVVIVDLENRRIVHTQEVAKDSLITANADSYFVISPNDKRVERWAFANWKRTGTGMLRIPGAILTLAMGHASRGPLLVHSVDTEPRRGNGHLSLVDVHSFRSQVISGNSREVGHGHPESPAVFDRLKLMAAANGSVFGAFSVILKPEFGQLIYPDRTPMYNFGRGSFGYLAPMADGVWVCTANGLCKTDLDLEDYLHPSLPATTADLYLSFRQGTLEVRRVPEDQVVRTLIPGDMVFDGDRVREGDLPIEQRFFLIPQLNLLAMVSPDSRNLVLLPVALGGTGFTQELDKAGGDAKRPKRKVGRSDKSGGKTKDN
jgi:hypothetical protein